MITTPSYVVGNFPWMPPRSHDRRVKTPEQRRRTYIMEWREFRGMSQQELGDRVALSKTQISRIENRVNGYGQDVLEDIADVLGVHQSVLLQRAPNDSDRMGTVAPTAKAGRSRSR